MLTHGSVLSPVRPGTGDPLGRDFADEETIAGAADVLLPCWGVLNGLQRETDRQTGGIRRQKDNANYCSVITDVIREEGTASGEEGASIISINVLLV